jgi:hypothetical protein
MPPRPTDVRSLKEQKKPGSAVEMSALLAYYLQHLAPASERKPQISAADVEKYFVQADFPLPKRSDQLLVSAKAAGYFDSPTRGAYGLTPPIRPSMTTAADSISCQAGSNFTILNLYRQPDRIWMCRFSSTHTFIVGTTPTRGGAQAGCSKYDSSWEGLSALCQRSPLLQSLTGKSALDPFHTPTSSRCRFSQSSA